MQYIDLICSCTSLLRQKFHIDAFSAKIPIQHTRQLLDVAQKSGLAALNDTPAEQLVALLMYLLEHSEDSLISSDYYEFVVNSDLSGTPGEVLLRLNWLPRMDSRRLAVLMEVLNFLWQATTSELVSTRNTKELAAVFAPLLCKPPEGVFMPSEHHSRMVEVVAFLIEQYDYLENYLKPYELPVPTMHESSHTPPRSGWKAHSPTSVISNQVEEMKIVRSLVSWVVGTSLRPTSIPPVTATSSAPSTPPVEQQKHSVGSVQMDAATPVDNTHTAPSVSSTQEPLRPPVVSNRRALLRTCKMLKLRIKKFEEAYKDEHGVMPKQDGDHEMVEVYAEYRRLKRLIREDSVTVIQKLFRGHIVRRRLKRSRNLTATMEMESETELDCRLSEDQADGPSVPRTERLRELTRRKSELKHQLKAFNNDFMKRHRREPGKADKEVIRHLYEEYNTIKNELKVTTGGKSKLSSRTAHDEHKRRRSGDVLTSINSSGDVQAGSTTSNSDDERVAALVKEKQTLHSLLKEYEKNFEAKYHRAVFSHEDIVPVAREFERYQEVKQLLSALQPKSRHRSS